MRLTSFIAMYALLSPDIVPTADSISLGQFGSRWRGVRTKLFHKGRPVTKHSFVTSTSNHSLAPFLLHACTPHALTPPRSPLPPSSPKSALNASISAFGTVRRSLKSKVEVGIAADISLAGFALAASLRCCRASSGHGPPARSANASSGSQMSLRPRGAAFQNADSQQ
jgi:hypothetical protein